MPRPASKWIEEHYVDWREALRWPLDWSDVFGRAAPLALEIGFGNGQFLVDWAAAHPERNHVGIELSWTAATHLFRRLDTAGLRNVRVLLIDAPVALRNLFTSGELVEVYANHPCPWPKDRHHARRLFQPEFTALLADRMRTGARLTVVTDHREYAGWLAGMLTAQSALVSCHPTAAVDHLPDRRPTKYESKARAEGIPIHYFEWEKADRGPTSSPSTLPRPLSTEDEAMPNLTLRGPHDPDRLLAAGAPRLFQETHAGVAVVVRLDRPYRRLEKPTWLVEALVREDGLQQRFGLLVRRHDDGALVVKLSDLGRPHPTHGVKRAVHCLGAWLRECAPGLAVAHHNLGAAAEDPAAEEDPD